TTLTSRVRAYGSIAPTAPLVDGVGAPPTDGEDHFVVDRLTPMDVARGLTLTLDGQAGNDLYEIFTEGSLGAARNYAINVLDTGARAEPVPNPDPGANVDAQTGGADIIPIYGNDSTDPAHNALPPHQNHL